MFNIKRINITKLIFISIILISVFFFKYGNDFYWHLKVGEYIFETRKIPYIDVFSWYGLSNNLQWISHEWLFEVIIYITKMIFGRTGPFILLSLNTLTLAILLYELNKENFDKHIFYSIIWSLLGLMSLCSFMLPRPHIFSYVFFTFEIIIIKKLITNKESTLIYYTPLLTILWANIHGGSSNLSYILYGIILGASIIPIKRKLNLDSIQTKKIIYALVTSIVSIAINPHGIKMIIYPYKNMTYTNMINCIDEWQPLSIHSISGICYLLFIIYILFTIIKNTKKQNIFHLLLALPFALLVLKSMRFMPFLYIIATAIIPNYWNNNNYIINEKIVFSFIMILFIVFGLFIYKMPDFEVINNKMITYINKNKDSTIYNSYNLGGYLIYKDIKPFVDGRADMYVNNILCDVCDIEKNNKYELLDKYKFNLFIVENNSNIYRYLSKNNKYVLIEKDNNNSIYILKGKD